MRDKVLIHKVVVSEALKAIVPPVIKSGGDPAELMVILESVMCGILLIVGTAESDKGLVDCLHERVIKRVRELRMLSKIPEGTA